MHRNIDIQKKKKGKRKSLNQEEQLQDLQLRHCCVANFLRLSLFGNTMTIHIGLMPHLAALRPPISPHTVFKLLWKMHLIHFSYRLTA